jgi:1-acyl-sn-glycerol-3-phosphate acyltransferase
VSADGRPPPPGQDARTWLGAPSRRTTIGYAAVRGLIRVVATLLGRVEVVGGANVPSTGAFILAPVHRSNVDFALTSIVTRRPMRYMGKDSIWRSALLGRFVSMLGAFPVHRGTADRESLRVCVELIEGGSPVVMFPEGTRRSGPVLADLFDGPAYVAARTGVPIVPLGIGGSERMMPKGARFLRPSKLVLIVGAPIPPTPAEGGRVRRGAVRSITARLRLELQRLFDEAQLRAGSPNERRPSA